MTLKLNLFFVAMDILILMAYPIVFIHDRLRRFVKAKESILLEKPFSVVFIGLNK